MVSELITDTQYKVWLQELKEKVRLRLSSFLMKKLDKRICCR